VEEDSQTDATAIAEASGQIQILTQGQAQIK
jgi:hypothetical protein